MEPTRVKTEACDDTHSMTKGKARATWDSRIYIKSLLCQGSNMHHEHWAHQASKILGILCKIHRSPRKDRDNTIINA